MSLDMVLYERQVYGLIDLLSDVGGLNSALMAMFALFIKLALFQSVDYYLVA